MRRDARPCISTVIHFFIFIFVGIQNIHAQSSVLSDGSWHRISVESNGIYKIRYEDLVGKHVLKSPVPSSQIALFSGENGTLSELNKNGEIFDLQEISILVEDGGDGQFGTGDYILFYGQSPSRWSWNASLQKYTHNTNVFTDAMLYFLTTDFLIGERKRLKNKPLETSPATLIITNFKDHYLYEKDLSNPFRSGQEWYGEKLDQTKPNMGVDLNLQGLTTSQNVEIRARFVVNEPGKVVVSSNNQSQTLSVSRNKINGEWMMELLGDFSWVFTNERPRLSFEYTRLSNKSSWMYLDFLELHYQRQLSLGNTSLQFRFADYESSEIGEFRIGSVSSTSRFWDISNPQEPQIIQGTLSGNIFSFRASLSEKPEFIGFSESAIHLITQFDSIKNQDLHGLDSIQYVIVVHPEFQNEAEQLAEFHRNRNLNVLVTTPTEIFNEFSFGRQDPMAIRRLLRHYRNKALAEGSDVLPEYLLLFGSPSYDYRNRTGDAQNFVLNYQFPTGLVEANSLSTDDMFGFLADGETGFQNSDRLHIGIGRFPARTVDQAQTLVKKTLSYAEPKFGDWRNVVTNLADDGVTEPFVQTYENYFEPDFKENFRSINFEKIYLDAYPQVATPSGARYPAAKEALMQRIERGTLILNYEGHSSEITMADEVIMNTSDIQNFENIDQLMVFFTASCSFARYDDPSLISAGEQTVLSPKGCAIAHVGASRIVYTYPNDIFHSAFNHFALLRDNNKVRTFGETMKSAKNKIGNSYQLKPFVLLGDPALPLALPTYKIVTTHINETPVQNNIDTIKALNDVSVSGKIVDFSNNLLSDFNGEISVTVYDKPTPTQTLGHKNSSAGGYNPVIHYDIQKNILFKGKVPVKNGKFTVEFMTPKDINYTYGFGKISYYAYSDSADATGVFDSVVIGGFGKDFDLVADAPIVRLFLNDTNFLNGNIATANPVLLAKISDQYGINHSGAGIGHNISLTIDDDFKKQTYLNDYFEYLSGSNTGGEVRFPMSVFNLAPGKHNLKLKVWNIFNISTLASLDFEVVESSSPIIAKAYCYPNPMTDHTKFYFTHNAPKKINRVEIDIFDLSGRWVTRLSKAVNTDGFAIDPIEWNTTDANGNKLRQGLYLYNLKIICEDGHTAQKVEKLIIGT